MAVTVSKPAVNIREMLSRLVGLTVTRTASFDFDGYDGVTTTQVLDRGWVPVNVFVDGVLQREGTLDDYTVSTALGVSTITFTTAPTVTEWVRVDAKQETNT